MSRFDAYGGRIGEMVRREAVGIDLDRLIEGVGEARFVLIGEASHGTHEFYQTRARITQRLIEEKGFGAVVVEADWPDAWRVNRWVRGFNDDRDADEALSGVVDPRQYAARETSLDPSGGPAPPGSSAELAAYPKPAAQTNARSTAMAARSVITGWRLFSEVLPLQWRHVDFRGGKVRLDPGSTKNRDGRVLPLTRELRALVEARREVTRDHLPLGVPPRRQAHSRLPGRVADGLREGRLSRPHAARLPAHRRAEFRAEGSLTLGGDEAYRL